MSDLHSIPAPATDYVFDLDGGRACLDFANTDSSSGDHLGSYADLVAFAAQSDLLTPHDAAGLRGEGEPDAAAPSVFLICPKASRPEMAVTFFRFVDAGRPAIGDSV